MLKNSIGNITEILALLDKNIYSEAELQNNYQMLVERWGEWEIIGANSAGLVIRYVDIGNALFSSLMITFGTFSIISFCIAVVFGKIVFPLLAKHFTKTNEEMVDLATLKSAVQVDEMSKKCRKEWF